MILNSCEHGDSIVVYTGVHCPVCKLEDEVKGLQDQYDALQTDFNSLETDYNNLEGELNDLKTN